MCFSRCVGPDGSIGVVGSIHARTLSLGWRSCCSMTTHAVAYCGWSCCATAGCLSAMVPTSPMTDCATERASIAKDGAWPPGFGWTMWPIVSKIAALAPGVARTPVRGPRWRATRCGPCCPDGWCGPDSIDGTDSGPGCLPRWTAGGSPHDSGWTGSLPSGRSARPRSAAVSPHRASSRCFARWRQDRSALDAGSGCPDAWRCYPASMLRCVRCLTAV